jgi:carbamoylphosphate synthase large subunit
MERKHILVFPCGSEVGLEIHRALKYCKEVKLYGANSIKDHGEFVFENYIGEIPFIDDPKFMDKIKKVVSDYRIHAIYPAMDIALLKLKENERKLGCRVISSPIKTLNLCYSKKKTYKELKNIIKTPKIYNDINKIKKFPVFIKPNIGYGSRNAKLINNLDVGLAHIKTIDDPIIMEYLSGKEYTVDCFTDRRGKLLYIGPRVRNRVRIGISVNTNIVNDKQDEFFKFAKKINQVFNLRGAWFFQVRRDKKGDLTLLEVASRIAGSSALHRGRGINLALLSVYDNFDEDLSVFYNSYDVEIDRAFDVVYKIGLGRPGRSRT